MNWLIFNDGDQKTMGLHKVLKGKVANLEILYSVNMPFKRKEAINRQNVQSVFFLAVYKIHTLNKRIPKH